MSTHLPRFVPADEPSYYRTASGITLKAEFARTITITCQACKVTQLPLKLLADTVLTQEECDRHLTAHLDGLGWTRLRDGGADICPECAATRPEVCDYCRDYTGGHSPTCPARAQR